MEKTTKTVRNTDKMAMLEPGDMVEGLGVVESNHCGLPWPAGFEDYFFGVVQVRNPDQTSVMCDAKTGKQMSDEEVSARYGAKEFDYDRRWQDNLGRRHPPCKTVKTSRFHTCWFKTVGGMSKSYRGKWVLEGRRQECRCGRRRNPGNYFDYYWLDGGK